MTDSALLGEFRVLRLRRDVEHEDCDGNFPVRISAMAEDVA